MKGDFPPSSSDNFLPLPGRRLPNEPSHLGRAGKGDLVHVGVLHQSLAGAPVSGHDVHHPGRETDLLAQLGKAQRRQRGEFGRLEHHGVSHGERGGNLPGQHQEREVPRDDLPDHSHRLPVGQLLLHELGPAGMVIEVARHQRHVDVAGFPDRLAVVERLQDGKEPAVLLNLPGDGVEVAGPAVPAEGPPVRLRLAGRRPPPDRCRRDSPGSASPGASPVAGFSVSNVSRPGSLHPPPINSPKRRPCALEPFLRRPSRLRCRSILHRLEDLRN